jgi:hypothetical protein
MSAIFCDGFDTYSSVYEKWLYVSGDGANARIITQQFRNGAQSLGFTGTSTPYIQRPLGSGVHATMYVHLAVRRATAAGLAAGGVVAAIIARSNNGAVAHASLLFFNNGNVQVTTGDYSSPFYLGNAVVGVIPLDTWCHVGWRITTAEPTPAPGGTSTIWINGAQVQHLTSVDTSGSGTYPTIDHIGLVGYGGSTVGAYQCFDDLIVVNPTGTLNNTYLGDMAVITLRPNGAGDRTQLAPVGGATNWQNVSESVHTGAAYNASNVDGQGDLYAVENLPANVGINFVQQSSYVRKNTVAAKSLAHIVKVGGVEYAQTAQALPLSFSTLTNVLEQNPAGGAWDSTALNAAQIGVEVRA